MGACSKQPARCVLVQSRAAKGLARLRPSISEVTGERRGVAPGSFVDLLVNATDKATGTSLTDLERTNQVPSRIPVTPLLAGMHSCKLPNQLAAGQPGAPLEPSPCPANRTLAACMHISTGHTSWLRTKLVPDLALHSLHPRTCSSDAHALHGSR